MEINGKLVTKIYEISYNFAYCVDITQEDRNDLVYVEFETKDSSFEFDAVSPEKLKSFDLDCEELEQSREHVLKQLRDGGIEC